MRLIGINRNRSVTQGVQKNTNLNRPVTCQHIFAPTGSIKHALKCAKTHEKTWNRSQPASILHNLNRPVIKETHKTNNLNRPVVWGLVIDDNRLYSSQRGSLSYSRPLGDQSGHVPCQNWHNNDRHSDLSEHICHGIGVQMPDMSRVLVFVSRNTLSMDKKMDKIQVSENL